MKQSSLIALLALLLTSVVINAQSHPVKAPLEKSKDASADSAYFVDPTILKLTLFLASPPAQNSGTTQEELAELHRIEMGRTPQQVLTARTDDQEQDIFIFKDVLGQSFTAGNLPLTATLSAHIHDDESIISKPIKASFSRPRPYQFDSTLHPVCALSKEPNSYPSGHTLSGYLLALTLVQMIPEKREQIMERADNYAHNRMVCGVHYASDVEASRTAAYAMFGYMLANPRFQKELEAAKQETRSQLSLP
jgi:acid phosphatase (class A)